MSCVCVWLLHACAVVMLLMSSIPLTSHITTAKVNRARRVPPMSMACSGGGDCTFGGHGSPTFDGNTDVEDMNPITPEFIAQWTSMLNSSVLCIQQGIRLSTNCDNPVVDIRPFKVPTKLKGGALGFKVLLTFKNKRRALFKPRVLHDYVFESEIVAFHLSELLQFHRVLPSFYAQIPVREYVQAFDSLATLQQKIKEKVVPAAKNQMIEGSIQALYEDPLFEFQLPQKCNFALKGTVTRCSPELRTEWAKCMIFDYLIGNDDRLTGGNIKKYTEGRDVPTLWLDHDRADCARRYCDLSVYQNVAKYWETMNLIIATRFHDVLTYICRYPPSVLNKLQTFMSEPGSLGNSLRAVLSSSHARVRLCQENYERLDLKMRLLFSRYEECT